MFNSHGVELQAHNVIHQNFSSNSLGAHLGEEWLDFVKQYAREAGKHVSQVSRTDLSHSLRNFYLKIFKENSYVTEVVELPLRLENQHFDLIFACKRTRRGNPFLAGVRYIKSLLKQTDYGLIDMLKQFIVEGRPPGLLRYVIEPPTLHLKNTKPQNDMFGKTNVSNRFVINILSKINGYMI